MDTLAVILQQPGTIGLQRLALDPVGLDEVVVDVAWSGISTGTERLLYTGAMPPFPGMGYPLVPGYESVGRVVQPGTSGLAEGQAVFIPGARCYGPVRGLFGGSASRVIVPARRLTPLQTGLDADAVLLALAATARHALAAPGSRLPDLIVGHGVLGRLLARLTLALGGEQPTVWETNPDRRTAQSSRSVDTTVDGDALPYPVIDPETDQRRDYHAVYDVSGADILDPLVQHLAPGGEIVLAGFYSKPLSLTFPPAFMREARFRVAAEWRQDDMDAVLTLVNDGRLSLAGLITHSRPADEATDAYSTAFGDPSCLKMILDWSACS